MKKELILTKGDKIWILADIFVIIVIIGLILFSLESSNKLSFWEWLKTLFTTIFGAFE